MGKREFTNRMSLRGAYLYATWQSQQNKIIGRDPHVGFSILLRMTIRMISRDPYVSPMDFLRMTIFKIGRSLEFFALQKIGVTLHAVILGQQRVTRVSRIIKWILGSSPRMTGERKCPMMTMLMWILISSMSMTSTVSAVCVPLPDCASIGYTSTSCEGGFVRCPFDTSKLYCVPCDSSFQYTCNGEEQFGQGESCGGKYLECGCSDGYEWDDVNKICTSSCSDTSCSVGNIMYSDGTCCKDVLSSKTAIGVVVKKNELLLSKMSDPTMYWANSYVDVSGVTNYTSSDTAKTDMNGKANTLAIVSAYTSDTTSNNAAKYCNYYTTAGTSAGDWYLPAAGELYTYVYGNYSTINSTMSILGWTFRSGYFWSSSESHNNSAWIVYSNDGNVSSSNKLNRYGSVSCFLDISGEG